MALKITSPMLFSGHVTAAQMSTTAMTSDNRNGMTATHPPIGEMSSSTAITMAVTAPNTTNLFWRFHASANEVAADLAATARRATAPMAASNRITAAKAAMGCLQRQ